MTRLLKSRWTCTCDACGKPIAIGEEMAWAAPPRGSMSRGAHWHAACPKPSGPLVDRWSTDAPRRVYRNRLEGCICDACGQPIAFDALKAWERRAGRARNYHTACLRREGAHA